MTSQGSPSLCELGVGAAVRMGTGVSTMGTLGWYFSP